MTKEHKKLREDLIYFIESLKVGSIPHLALLGIVEPTAEEVTEFYKREGGNTERSLETFGVDPDDLSFTRGA